MPLPVCCFARAPWCGRFRGQASSGNDQTDRQTLYGFRWHLRPGWPGVITHVFLAPANEADGETASLVLGDRNSCLPDL
jgi:hypothetical protein